MKNVAIYARASQDRDELRDSVERQLDDCRKLAELKELNVVARYIDNDVSATSRKPRPQWEEMLVHIRSKEISGIVVTDNDRLYRTLEDVVVLLKIAKTTPLTIHGVRTGDLDLATPSGQMLASMLASAASFEVMQKGIRSARKNLETAKNGGYHGGPVPMGYKLGETTGTLEIDERQASTLREAARRLIQGATLNATTRWVREELGRPKLKPNSLKDALTRPTIAGYRRHVTMTERREWNELRHDEKVSGDLPENVSIYPAQWKPVLSYDEWQDVRHVLLVEERKRGRPAGKSLLSGILICEICYSKLGYSESSYKCPGKDRNGCAGLAISTPAIEGLVRAYVRTGHRERTEVVEPLPPLEIDRSAIREVEDTRKRFLELFRRRRITEDELNQQLDLLEAEMQRFERSEVEAHRRRVHAERSRRIDRTTWDESDLAKQREIVNAVFPDGITIFKAIQGRKSGAKFDAARVFLGPPPWLDERLPLKEREKFAEARELRLAGTQTSGPAVFPDMSIAERDDHNRAFREWQHEVNEHLS
jgi:site-specific DNA recombinase